MWQSVKLAHGAGAIERICDLFQVYHPKVPGGRFKVKVLERTSGDFLAVPNLFVKKDNGDVDYISGLGFSVNEALEDLFQRFLPTITTDDPAFFEWSDPHDF